MPRKTKVTKDIAVTAVTAVTDVEKVVEAEIHVVNKFVKSDKKDILIESIVRKLNDIDSDTGGTNAGTIAEVLVDKAKEGSILHTKVLLDYTTPRPQQERVVALNDPNNYFNNINTAKSLAQQAIEQSDRVL